MEVAMEEPVDTAEAPEPVDMVELPVLEDMVLVPELVMESHSTWFHFK